MRETMTNVTLRYALLSVAALLWYGGGVFYGIDLFAQFMVGLLVMAAGFGLAAWKADDSRALAAAGLGLSLVGLGLFLGRGLFLFNSEARIGSHLFGLGTLVLMAGLYTRPIVLRAGAAICIVGTLYWIVADAEPGGWAWQWGNLVALGALAWMAVRPGDAQPETAGATA